MKNENILSFEMFSDDIHSAKKSYSSWELSNNESPVDFIEKKKTIDLVYLLNDVIENELDKSEQEVLNLYYLNSMSFSDISKQLNVNRSTVSRKVESINKKIYNSLKYAVMYKNEERNIEVIPIAIREALSIYAIKASSPTSIGGRLLKLRTIANLNYKNISNSTGISVIILNKLETGKLEITTTQAICLSSFFNVSIDYLLMGKNFKEKK